jgi:hypothetical protein
MTRILTRSAIVAITLLLLTSANARAGDMLTVKVPFPFVVHGQSFPAGNYTIEREDMASSVLLIRGNRGNTAAAFVATTPARGHDPSGDTPVLQFTRHEDQYRLSTIWESGSDGLQVRQ